MVRKYAPEFREDQSTNPENLAPKGSRVVKRRWLLRDTGTAFPRLLYRYIGFDPKDAVSIDRLRDVLVRSEFWLASPKSLNDPFDLACHIDFIGPGPEMRQRIHEIAKQHGGKWKERKRKVAQLMADPRVTQHRMRESFRHNLNRVGICCFTTDPKSIQMWSYYGKSHTGLVLCFCVGHDIDVMTRSLPVVYSKDYPVIDWLRNSHHMQLMTVLRRKHDGWSHESEWRIPQPNSADSYLRFDPAAMIGVIFGCEASDDSVQSVNSLLAERSKLGFPKVKLFRAVRHPKAYRLQCKRV